jgi:hypothetical protein
LSAKSSIDQQGNFEKRALYSLVAYLERAKQHVIWEKHHTGEDLRYAVRLLSSRQRLLQRQFIATHGEEFREREIALLELAFNTDDGTLLQLGGWKHGRGRYLCGACHAERAESETKRFIRICPHCQEGFQHVNQLLWDPEKNSAVGYTGLTQEKAQELQDNNYFCLAYKCENCQKDDLEKQFKIEIDP